MTSIRREPTNRIDALMCARSLGLHDASYTQVSSHLRFLASLTIPMPVGHRFISSRGSINRVGRSIQQTLGFHLGSSPELSTVWQESGRQALSIDYGPPYAQGVRPTPQRGEGSLLRALWTAVQ